MSGREKQDGVTVRVYAALLIRMAVFALRSISERQANNCAQDRQDGAQLHLDAPTMSGL